MVNKNILIVSTSIDNETILPVSNYLFEKGFEVVNYQSDKVFSQDTSLDIHVDDNGTSVMYDNTVIDNDSIVAAWFRHPYIFGYNPIDKAKKLTIEDEVNSLQSFVWDSLSEDLWLNAPDNISRAQNKTSQLVVAQGIGFNVPETLITNQWSGIKKMAESREVIMKMSKGLLYENDEVKGLYTTPLDINMIDKLSEATSPFPGIYQPNINKAREWRITVVGDNVFDASIYTTDDAKDDWRKHQYNDKKVEFKNEIFPGDEKDKCIKYLGKYGLKFGAFDFIENKEGMITFLECNPNGQFKWLEDKLNFPISTAIGDELIKIAVSNNK